MNKLALIFLGTLLALSPLINAQNEITRVEPPVWWVGMKNPDLQLLIYGSNISELQPEINHQGVKLQSVTKVDNPNYLFIDLKIEPTVTAGAFNIVFKQNGKVATQVEYKLLSREASSAKRVGFNPSDVIYLVTPDRFANGNPENDSMEGLLETKNRNDKDGRHGGDLEGIMDHLDYIHNMGFTALWLNPVLENNEPQTSYHGYATTDFYKVDPRFGTNEQYKKLSRLAQQKGMKLIMDMIVNHCGISHWWMDDLPSEDWINFNGKFVPTNHRRTTNQDPYVSQKDKMIFSDGWFVQSMPDLNQRNPFLAKYLIQNSIWWIEYAGLSGIRMDTYPYPDKQFMSEWTKQIMREYPNFNIVGEEWSMNPAIVSYWQRGKVNANGYVSYLPSLMDFPLQSAMSTGLNEKEGWDVGFNRMYEMLANDFIYADPYNLVIFPDNHDMSRIFTQLHEDYDLYKMATAYILTMRGIPQIFYGTEILMTNPGTTDHGIIRSDFPGGWDGDKKNAFTNQGLTTQEREAKQYMHDLLNWRKNMSVIHQGKLTHFAPENGVYVYFRYDDEQKIMVILNKNNVETSLRLDRFSEILGNAKGAREVLTGDQVSFDNGVINIPARAPYILTF